MSNDNQIRYFKVRGPRAQPREGQKKCCKCQQWKLRGAFNKNTYTADGLQYWCKQCLAERHLEKKRLALKNSKNIGSNTNMLGYDTSPLIVAAPAS